MAGSCGLWNDVIGNREFRWNFNTLMEAPNLYCTSFQKTFKRPCTSIVCNLLHFKRCRSNVFFFLCGKSTFLLGKVRGPLCKEASVRTTPGSRPWLYPRLRRVFVVALSLKRLGFFSQWPPASEVSSQFKFFSLSLFTRPAFAAYGYNLIMQSVFLLTAGKLGLFCITDKSGLLQAR